MIIGYSLIEVATSNELATTRTLPHRFHVPGVVRMDADKVGLTDVDGNYIVAERHSVDRPTRFHTPGVETVSYDGEKIIVDPNFTAPAVADVQVRIKAEILQYARGILNETDWMSLRASEDTNKPTPTSIKSSRRAVRVHSGTLQTEIDTLTTLAQLDAWVQHDWPSVQ
jgi:hypothetical protein